MPVTINQLETQIEVEPVAAQAEAPREPDAAQALQRWIEIAREQLRREVRTAAWGFDD